MLLDNIFSNTGSTVNLVCPEGQTITVEVMPSVDDRYQLILRSSDLHSLVAVRLALLNRLEVSSSTGYLFHIIYTALVFTCFISFLSQFLPCDCECIRTVLLSTSVCPYVKHVDCDKTK